jgi:1-acyl-sn-glycerol-3-phosphate acyltransferase
MSSRIENIRSEFLTGFLPELAFRIHISEDSTSKIADISDNLSENPDLSFIIYFNHISFNDPMFAAHIIRKIDGKHSRHLIAPASYFHTEQSNPKNKNFIFMMDLAKKSGFEIIRVIQAYQVDNPKYGYTKDEAQATYLAFLRRLKELQSTNVPSGLIISPEGTRSDDGILGIGEPGILAIGRFMAPVMYIPLGISYKNGYDRNNFNIGKNVDLSIGESYIQNERKDQPSLNELMSRLALALPKNMRGSW